MNNMQRGDLLVEKIILELLSKEIELGRILYLYEIREILVEYLVEEEAN